MDMHRIDRAFNFAKREHDLVGQVRKYSNDPYWVHCIEVKELVQTTFHTEDMLIAALLHDTVEDTRATLAQIRAEFGQNVARLVEELTDISLPTDGNRVVRKTIDRNHLAKASPEAQTIKLADLIVNGRDILAKDPKFAKVFLEEKRLLLKVLTKGCPMLMTQAQAIVAQGLH